jgi:hypothetical protein
MPRYAGSNFAALDPEFRKANTGGGDPKKRRYAYGKQNNVLVAQGADLFANGFTIRLMPLYDGTTADDAGNRSFVNFREGASGEIMGDWCRLFTCANWVGNPGICFIIHDGNPDTSPYDSPYHIFRNVAWNNSSQSKSGMPHPRLGRLFDELLSKNFVPKSHVGSLRRPEQTLFVSASAVGLDANGQPTLLAFGDDPKKNARIIGLKTSAAQSLHAALAVRDESTGEFLAGDMLSFGSSKLITFLPETYTNNSKNSNGISLQGSVGVQVPKQAQQQRPVLVGYPPSRSSMTHFCVVHDQYNGQDIALEPYAEKIVADSKSWDEYMYFPTFEEQAEMLATAFPREALEFAWQDHPQFLRALPRGTATVDMGDRAVEDLEEADGPAVAPRQSFTRPAPARPAAPAPAPAIQQAPWEGESELSQEEAAGVDAMFGSPAPAPAPAAATPAARASAPANTADIIARARAAAARNR